MKFFAAVGVLAVTSSVISLEVPSTT